MSRVTDTMRGHGVPDALLVPRMHGVHDAHGVYDVHWVYNAQGGHDAHGVHEAHGVGVGQVGFWSSQAKSSIFENQNFKFKYLSSRLWAKSSQVKY